MTLMFSKKTPDNLTLTAYRGDTEYRDSYKIILDGCMLPDGNLVREVLLKKGEPPYSKTRDSLLSCYII